MNGKTKNTESQNATSSKLAMAKILFARRASISIENSITITKIARKASTN